MLKSLVFALAISYAIGFFVSLAVSLIEGRGDGSLIDLPFASAFEAALIWPLHLSRVFGF